MICSVKGSIGVLAAFFGLGFQHVIALPAFPGAEGAGAEAVGGRGGDVYFVTNTNNTGAGSLRNGITGASGPRTIIFRVSGNIDLTSDLSINKSYLTIAGQTAPGDGITLRRRNVRVSAARDVVIRHLRFRPGDLDSSFEGDAFWVNNASNVMIDHVSSSWSVDECLSVTDSTNVTVQWSMISESLRLSQHAKGAHGYGSLLRYGHGSLTFHHNLYQHHDSRNPRLGDNLKLDFVNNVIYNWGGRAGYSAADGGDNPDGFTNYLNYVANYLVAGPSTGPSSEAFRGGAATTFIFQSGNRIDSNKNSILNGLDTGWNMFTSSYTAKGSRYPLPLVTADTAPVAYQRVLAFAGASFARDSVDTRLIRTVNAHNGRLVDAVGSAGQATDYVTNNINGTNYVFVRGWPVLNSTFAPADADNDGIPDYFEIALGWNPGTANNNHFNADGYTDLEWYLNWLADPHAEGAMNQPILIDLRQLAGGMTNLSFNSLVATNGTVSLLNDGYTARFHPSTNFMGLATFTFVATNSVDAAGFGPVPVAVLVSNVAPSLVLQPLSATNEIGQTATFMVQADGGALQYRWQKDGTNLNDSATVSGATNPTLMLSNLSAPDAAGYRVVITNHVGSVTSTPALLVIRSNHPPTLLAIEDRALIAGATLSVTNSAGDPDLPEQTLSFALETAPVGASIDPLGVITWRPLIAQSGTTNPFSVVAFDNGTPSLSATQSFSVNVLMPVQPTLKANWESASGIQLTIEGDSGPDYTVETSTNLLEWVSVETNNAAAPPWVWTDPASQTSDRRFYRILLGP